MPATLLLGGARSGKSSLALRIAGALSGSGASIIATAEALDAEMADRIAAHRAERSPEWTTVEEPIGVVAALAARPALETVVVDCVTLWVANLLGAGIAEDLVHARAAELAVTASSRPGRTIVVSNEVGSGIVPDNPLARGYRDLLGAVNTTLAQRAEQVMLVVAGRVLELQRAEDWVSAGIGQQAGWRA